MKGQIMITTIDIETMPDVSRVKYLPVPVVKYGNTKDPEKRAAMDVYAKEKQVEKMALDPMFGVVVAFSVVQDGGVIESHVIKDIKGEPKMLDYALEYFRMQRQSNNRICTWNGTGFDIPFLYKRALLIDLKNGFNLTKGLPSIGYYTKRYTTETHIDLPLIWNGWSSQAGFTSLNSVAYPLLGRKKIDFDVKKISEIIKTPEGRKEIKMYCEQDTILTDDICHACEGVLF